MSRIPNPTSLQVSFLAIKKNHMMCLTQEIALLVISGLSLKKKKQACAESPCCFKKSAVIEVDPCGGVEKHPTSFVMELICFVHEEEVSLCHPGPFWTHRTLNGYDKLHRCDIRIVCV